MEVKKNTIAGFSGSWSSGLAALVFTDGTSVCADSGPLGRSLIDAFDCYGQGHCIDNDKLAGQEVVWWEDDFGLTLGGFLPYQDWLENGYPELDEGVAYLLDQDEDGQAHVVRLEDVVEAGEG